MTDVLGILLKIGELFRTHQIVASFLLVAMILYGLIRVRSYVAIPDGLMGLTQKNRIINYCKKFVIVFAVVMIINLIATSIVAKYYSIYEVIVFVRNNPDITIEEIPGNILTNIKRFSYVIIAAVFLFDFEFFIVGKLESIQNKELDNKFTSFSIDYQYLLIGTKLFYGVILMVVGGVCRDNIVLYNSLLALIQSIIFIQQFSSFQLGYADYKILVGCSKDRINKRTCREWMYIYAVSDDMQFFECGNKVSQRRNSVIKVLSLQELSEKNMKIQPTYAKKFRLYFSDIQWEKNLWLLLSKRNEINIRNPLNFELKYALIEIRYYRKHFKSNASKNSAEPAYDTQIIEIEQWYPGKTKCIKLKPIDGTYSYITLAMLDCETE